MIFSLKQKLAGAGIAAMLAGGGLGFHFWLANHDAEVRAESANGQIEKDRAQAKADLAAALKVKEAELAAVKTPEQAVKVINRYLPLPVPVQIETTEAPLPESLKELASSVRGLQVQTPEPPDAPIAKPLLIPAEDIVPAGKAVIACEECKIKLAAAEKDNQALEAENKNLSDAAKGGPWLKRLGRQLKVIGCAGAGGAIGGTRDWKTAAGGAAAGAVLCTLF